MLLASEGVEIFTCGRDEQHLKDGLERINQVGKGDGINVDLATREGVDRFFDEADKRVGGYDIAVINAAIPVDGVEKTGEDDARYAIATDYVAYVMSAYKAAKAMGDKGDLILIGSMSAHSLGASSSNKPSSLSSAAVGAAPQSPTLRIFPSARIGPCEQSIGVPSSFSPVLR